jgi:hypothetical protein
MLVEPGRALAVPDSLDDILISFNSLLFLAPTNFFIKALSKYKLIISGLSL